MRWWDEKGDGHLAAQEAQETLIASHWTLWKCFSTRQWDLGGPRAYSEFTPKKMVQFYLFQYFMDIGRRRRTRSFQERVQYFTVTFGMFIPPPSCEDWPFCSVDLGLGWGNVSRRDGAPSEHKLATPLSGLTPTCLLFSSVSGWTCSHGGCSFSPDPRMRSHVEPTWCRAKQSLSKHSFQHVMRSRNKCLLSSAAKIWGPFVTQQSCLIQCEYFTF